MCYSADGGIGSPSDECMNECTRCARSAEVEMRESLKKAYDTHCQLTFRGLIEIKMQLNGQCVGSRREGVGWMQKNGKFLSTNDYTYLCARGGGSNE